MRILYTTDLHGNETLFDKFLDIAAEEKPDIVLFGGDLAPKGPLGGITKNIQETIVHQRMFLEQLTKKLGDFKKNHNIPVCCIMGNDDYRINAGILERAQEKGDLYHLQNKHITLNGQTIIGYPFINVTPFRLKDWEKYDERNGPHNLFILPIDRGFRTIEEEENPTTIEEDLALFSKKVDIKKSIWLFHAPPYGTALDMLYNGTHVGSRAIRLFIETQKPMLTLHGHIHESSDVSGQWKITLGKTVSINPGSDYAHDELRYVEIDTEKCEAAQRKIIPLHEQTSTEKLLWK